MDTKYKDLLKKGMAARDDSLEDITVRKNYALAKNWQEGKGWIGPMISNESLKKEIERGFISQDVIATGVLRVANAVAGKEPRWNLTVKRPLGVKTVKDPVTGFERQENEAPDDAEQALIKEAEAFLTEWWDFYQIQPKINESAWRLAWAGKSPLRMYVPNDEFVDGVIPRAPVDETLKKIMVQSLDPDIAGVIRDEHGRDAIGWFLYEDETGKTRIEVSYRPRPGNLTYVGVLDQNREAVEEEVVYDIGGRLLMYEMRARSLVNDAVISQQKALDHNQSMISRNNTLAGFRERVYINAVPPKEKTTREQAIRAGDTALENSTRVNLGAGLAQWLKGLPELDNMGNVTGYATPDVIYKDPVAQEGLINTATLHKQAILEGMFQAHVLTVSDAMASAVSRQQAVSDHVSSLEEIQRQIEYAVRWMLETALKFAAFIAGQPNRYDGLRAVVQCRVSAVQLTPDEKRVIIEQYDANLISQETAMSLLGIEDVDAEISRIEASRSRDIEVATITAQKTMEAQNNANGGNNGDGATRQNSNGNPGQG